MIPLKDIAKPIGFKSMQEVVRNVIGWEYLNRTIQIEEETEFVQTAFEEISKVNRELFAQIPYEVIFTLDDPYTSAKHMREEVQRTGKIYIYTGYEGHPYLDEENNSIGRAVHDVFAHCVCGCPFNFIGEYAAYLEQRKYYPQWTWDVLFAEIPAQTAAFYANNKSHVFKQRAIVAPKEWVYMCEKLDVPNFSDNSILSSLF